MIGPIDGLNTSNSITEIRGAVHTKHIGDIATGTTHIPPIPMHRQWMQRICKPETSHQILAFHFQRFHSYVCDASYFACMVSSDNRALIRPIQFIIACFNRYAFMEVSHHLDEAFNVLCLSDLF
eukprot:105104_1